jgi:hypothetical protein
MSEGKRRDFPPAGNGPGTSEEVAAFGDAPSGTNTIPAVSSVQVPVHPSDGTVSGGHAAAGTRDAEVTAAPEPDGRDISTWAATPDFLGAVTSVLELLPEVKSAHGLALLIGLRQAHAQGRRPVTCGEAREFLGRARQISPAGSKKVVRRLVEQGLAVPVPNPCIDKAIDLHASARLARVIPTLGQPYTLYRISRDGEIARKKFDTAWLDWRRVAPENQRMAEWISLWEGLRPGQDQVPTSLTPFFASPLAKRASPIIAGVVSVAAASSKDYEILSFDGPGREDRAFVRGLKTPYLRDFKYPSWRMAMRADFQLAKDLAEPIFHHLTGKMSSVPHDYYRLILPISTCGGKVDLLIILVESTKDRMKSELA